MKCQFKTTREHRFLTNAQAADEIGETRESGQKDRYGSIERSNLPSSFNGPAEDVSAADAPLRISGATVWVVLIGPR